MPAPFALPHHLDACLSDRLRELAERQQGVARRDQLTACGLSKHVIDNMVESGRWAGRGGLIVVLHNGPLTTTQAQWAAVLNAGVPAGLAARTAAASGGLTGWEAECIEIVVPKGTLIPTGLGLDVKVHESRRFCAADLHPSRLPPSVTIERALVDAAVWSRRARTACGLLAAGVQQRLTTPDRLLEELSHAGAVRHRKVLAAALIDIEGGAQAMSEIDFLRFCRRNGLPAPILQVVRTDPGGRRRYIDASFKRRDGSVVRVEIDGALHLLVRTYWDDMSRGNELVIGGEKVLRLPSFVVHANDGAALSQLRRFLNLSLPGPAMTG